MINGGADVEDFYAQGPPDDDTRAHETPKPESPFDIVARWKVEGPLVRVPTGIRPLDELCRGGLPIPWRVIIIGAPSAGKTFVSTVVADAMAKRLEAEGICVGILAVDEEPDDVTVRLAQIVGFTVAQAEQRDPAVLEAIAEKLADLYITFYDANWTIEQAAADLSERAKAQKKRAALFIDSIHAAVSSSALLLQASSPRLEVQANCKAMRAMAARHRMLLVATGEANRAAYRSDDAAENSNDMSAGAESRAIEFVGQTLLMLRTPKDHPDVAHVRVPKNRRAKHGEFWLKLDGERHTLTECSDPVTAPGMAEERDHKKRTANKRALENEARAVLKIIAASPGIGTRGLRAAVKLGGLKIGKDSLEAVLLLLTQNGRVENRPTRRGKNEDPHYFAASEIDG